MVECCVLKCLENAWISAPLGRNLGASRVCGRAWVAGMEERVASIKSRMATEGWDEVG